MRRRLDGGLTRPLAQDSDALAKVCQDRRPLYARADFRVEVDPDDVREIVRRIRALPIF